MAHWQMLTLVGKDQPGIVAAVSAVLYKNNANLGEAAMQRLGANFTIMMMVDYAGSAEDLLSIVTPVAARFGLKEHVDVIEGRLHAHLQADVSISLYGADRAGIVASATERLAQAGLHILALHTDVAGTEEKPVFVMEISGHAAQGVEALREAVDDLDDLEIHIDPLQTMIG